MGINISHGSNRYGEERRSAATIANLGKHLAHVLPGRHWRTVSTLFDGSFSDTAFVSPGRAGQIASVLRRAAADPKMPREWAAEAALFADAAGRAAAAGEPWMWS
jgi:hypothetical protein